MNLNEFESAIVGGIPFGEAAAFLIKIKTAAPVPPPDETGELEGQFSIPTEQVVALLGELVKNEFETIYAYHVYSQSLRDLSHDAIASHFEEHADDELEHADFLMKRMSVLGGPVQVPDLTAPAPDSDPVEIVKTMIRMEQEGIVGWKRLLAVVGDNPMRIKAEEYMAKEQEHLDDLWQLLPHQENMPIVGPPVGAPADAAPPGPPEPAAVEAMKSASARFRKVAETLGLDQPISSEMGEPTRPFAEKVSADRVRASARAKLAAAPAEDQIQQRASGVEIFGGSDAQSGLDESYPPPSVPDGKYPWGVTQSLGLGPKEKVAANKWQKLLHAGKITAEDVGSAAAKSIGNTRYRTLSDMGHARRRIVGGLEGAAGDGGLERRALSTHLHGPSDKVDSAIRRNEFNAYDYVGSRDGKVTRIHSGPRSLKEHADRKKKMLKNLNDNVTAHPKLSSAFALLRKLAERPDINQYLAREQMMAGAQEANELEYYKQQAQMHQAAIQQKDTEGAQLQEQMQATQQQLQQMQAELDQSGQMQRQILEQARGVEQQASQTAAAAHQAASASTLQAMQASQEVLRHKQMTAQLQQSVQAWKDGLMAAAAADPTAQAGQQVGMPMSGPMPQPLTAPPDAGVPTEGGEIPQAPADQAASAEGPAASPSPEGGGEQPKAKTTAPEPEKDTTPATKQSSVWAYYRALSGMKKQATPIQRAIGGAIGAGIGGLAGYGSSKADLEDPKIQELEAQKAQGGGSFARDVQLAGRKFRQGVLQAAHDNPRGAMLGGAGVFGMMGAGMAPMAAENIGNIPALASDVRKLFSGAKGVK